MSELDKFVQPDLVMTINQVENQNYEALVRRAPKNRSYKVGLPGVITFDNLQTRVVNLRDQLTQWSKRYDQLLDRKVRDGLHCDAASVRPLWNFLADWGREMYQDLFNIQRDGSAPAKLAKSIRGLKEDSQIMIDAPRMVIPWGLLYDGELPAADDSNYVETLLKHFWGFRYQLELQPSVTDGDEDEADYFYLHPYLDNTDITRVTVAINKKSDVDYQTGQTEFFEKLPARYKFSSDLGAPASPEVNYCRDTVINSMMKLKEPQHLLYFYCHHAKGEGVTSVYGSKDYKEATRIMLDGESNGVIALKELKKLTSENKIPSFKCPPLIFLNACDSGQLEMGDPSSFMEYFMMKLRAVDYVGTEANVPALFADHFGRRFIEEFLEAKPVGKILLDLNRDFAKSYYNPFGLYYSLFGLAQIKLNKSVEEIKL